jgi:flagellar biosynthesis protein FliR
MTVHSPFLSISLTVAIYLSLLSVKLFFLTHYNQYLMTFLIFSYTYLSLRGRIEGCASLSHLDRAYSQRMTAVLRSVACLIYVSMEGVIYH